MNFLNGSDFMWRHVLFLSGSSLQHLDSNLVDRLSMLTQLCFGGPVTIYPQHALRYRFMYVMLFYEDYQYTGLVSTDRLLRILDRELSSMAHCYFFPDNTMEIYTVCTLPKYRGKGNVTTMFNMIDHIINTTPYKVAELGVDFNNPTFMKVVHQYLRLGYNSEVKVTTESNHIRYQKVFLSMTKVFNKPKVVNMEDIMLMCKQYLPSDTNH